MVEVKETGRIIEKVECHEKTS